ncbi:MAG: inorganic phosphate transporter [Candidatus Devosia phytovorans]|uniref:Phosphate transporter n=1 Tax=Candidatus Devosia phytovorans TaxID=3121372 RepID=A0AAJ6B1L8_9HYPH|nr:inorganic phosphate transporter [Devosia sp.]WEK05484.1 MAG: inorganic phosphate transporter [Devosia sp.]
MQRIVLPLGIALLFLLAVAAYASQVMAGTAVHPLVILAAAAAAYMALNIGANDVANNMGPAVGARAIRMGAALAIAAACDLAGALIAGGDVVRTVSTDLLISGSSLPPTTMAMVMISALLAAALWINASTFVGTPVSTTHAIIGAIVGAAIAAAGLGTVRWPTIGMIAVSWVFSPLLGAIFAAALHAVIRRLITRRADKLAAARHWVPLLVATMAGVFAMYLANKALGHWWQPSLGQTLLLGLCSAAAGWLVSKPWVELRSLGLGNRKKQVATLFRPPLIVAAALLSFAHGANDVSNTIGPLAAILHALHATPDSAGLILPYWTLLLGAVGIGLGILLFGPRVIHTVGEQITKLNEIRAFCVALSAGVTVLTAAAFGLPISTTHVAVGAVFGVGFLREYLAIRNMHGAAVPVDTHFLDASRLNDRPEIALRRERRYERRFLVRRLKLARIGAAWLVTLPASAVLAVLAYWLLQLATG